MPHRPQNRLDAEYRDRHLASRYRKGEILIRTDGASPVRGAHVVELYDGTRWKMVAWVTSHDAANAVRRLVRG